MEYLHTLAVVTSIAAAAAWRWFDGTAGILFGVKIPGSVRNSITGLIAGVAAVVGLGATWWAIWPAAVATASIAAGYTKWEDAGWQWCRFYGPGCLAGAPLFVLLVNSKPHDPLSWLPPIAYALACGFAGVSYSFMKEEHARWILGGTVVGGLALL